jgi:antitoxin MazE
MQVSKWGNSLAIRIPADVVRSLGLKEGDELEVKAMDNLRLEVARKLTREEVLARLKAYDLQLPADGSWKLSRDEINGVDRLL